MKVIIAVLLFVLGFLAGIYLAPIVPYVVKLKCEAGERVLIERDGCHQISAGDLSWIGYLSKTDRIKCYNNGGIK